MTDRMLFIGASTAGSSIFELFPSWAAILGIEASLEGYDIPLGAAPEAFRAAVEHIADDPQRLGALVTTHKVDVYQHAGALFDELDANARLCREVSCVSKRDGALVGHAKDPITAGRTLAEFLAPNHWATGAQALCLGAGGAGTAIAVHLLDGGDGPEEVSCGNSTTVATFASCSRRSASRTRVASRSTMAGATSSTVGAR
jgi:shikimate dehydrogenase